MPRQTNALEFNRFVAGLITEASPLTFPDNASLDEQNFVLRRDGARRRRLGLDFEDNFQMISTTVSPLATDEVAFRVYSWANAGGNPRKQLAVVQIGNQIKVFDTDKEPISSSEVYSKKFPGIGPSTPYSFATVDGTLVIATGDPEITVLTYEDGSITSSSNRLLIRDSFGIEDIIDSEDLRVGNGVTTRPTSLPDAHLYNLRNQTWGPPRKGLSVEDQRDLIFYFNQKMFKYPSNSDVVTYSLYPDANDGGDRLTDRFNWKDVGYNPIGSTAAPRGHFIIDALARGTSRLTEEAKLRARYPQLSLGLSNLPKDTTPGGATVIAEYAGRVFYSGFSGDVIDGDKHSPKMSSYVLFSQLVEDPTDIFACYQDGDPTSKEEPDLLDTDGGFIRLEGAYGISRMIAVNNALVVVAANGVWLIQGGSDYGFKATNYLVTKVSDYGCSAPGSVVQVDSSVMFWGEDGIYVVAQNQFGDYVAENLTQKTIQTFYEDIESLDKVYCNGVYDGYERKVYWTYGNRIQKNGKVRQLVFDTTLGAFYPFVFGGDKYPMIIGGIKVPPYRVLSISDEVTVNGEVVTADGDIVTVAAEVEQSALNETVYVAVSEVSPTITFSFAKFKNDNFKDWDYDGAGTDAKAFLLTGWVGGGDFQRYKQIPYVTFHFVKTEDGFEEDGFGDWVPTGRSSCLVSSQWEWANSINSGRWGKQFQAYRIRHHYFPESLDDNFNNGFYTVVSKNKLRGKGKVVSLLIETEPERDCYLLGWSMVVGTNGTV